MNDMDRGAGETVGIAESTWEVDGGEVRILTATDSNDDLDLVQVLMALLECTELEARHVLRIIREDGEFITSVHADIEELPLTAA